jgi:hypothetical protein
MGDEFKPIVDAAGLMRGFPSPWFVSGGWAIDLFLGNVTRKHTDIEIGIYRRDQQALWRQLPGWSFEKAIPRAEGTSWMRWTENEELELPVHQIRAKREAVQSLGFDVFLNERTDTYWFSRRHPGLTRPLAEAEGVGAFGIPILSPEIQLLFKAKQTRAKDQADFEATLPRLTARQRDWLARALREFYPEHFWSKAIG